MKSVKPTLILLLVSSFAGAQTKLHFTDPNSTTPVFINEIHVTGTRSLDSTQLNEIVGPLNQRKVGGTREIGDRLRFQFQNYGYFLVDVKSVNVKRLDPLASLPPVDVEAEVEEGPRFKFDTIQFTGNHALSAEELRSHFPIRKGEYFSRSKVGSGLEALREAYGKLGYIELTAVPDTKLAPGNATLNLLINVDEGRQFRMGKLQLEGDPEIVGLMRSRWKLEEGQPFDTSYYTEFLKENGKLLGEQDIGVGYSTKLARDCSNNTITVFVEYAKRSSATAPSDVNCDNKPKTSN